MAQSSVHLRAAARYGPAQVTSLSWKAQFALSSAGTLKAARRPETRMKESVSGSNQKPRRAAAERHHLERGAEASIGCEKEAMLQAARDGL